ncbi:hypothetical protein [Undibacterium sp. Di24W]
MSFKCGAKLIFQEGMCNFSALNTIAVVIFEVRTGAVKVYVCEPEV